MEALKKKERNSQNMSSFCRAANYKFALQQIIRIYRELNPVIVVVP